MTDACEALKRCNKAFSIKADYDLSLTKKLLQIPHRIKTLDEFYLIYSAFLLTG